MVSPTLFFLVDPVLSSPMDRDASRCMEMASGHMGTATRSQHWTVFRHGDDKDGETAKNHGLNTMIPTPCGVICHAWYPTSVNPHPPSRIDWPRHSRSADTNRPRPATMVRTHPHFFLDGAPTALALARSRRPGTVTLVSSCRASSPHTRTRKPCAGLALLCTALHCTAHMIPFGRCIRRFPASGALQPFFLLHFFDKTTDNLDHWRRGWPKPNQTKKNKLSC